MKDLIYPTAEEIIEYNLLALELIKVKKADKPKVLSRSKIVEVIQECEKIEGVLQGIRKNYYLDEEIKEWIKNGNIKEFKR